MKERRATLPVLLVLLAFLGGAGYLLYRAQLGPRLAGSEHAPSRDRQVSIDDEGARWRHYDWSGAPDETLARSASTPHGLITPPDDEAYDPQIWAMRRSYPGGGDAGVALPFQPAEHHGRLIASEGELPVPRDARCEVRVLPVASRQYNCLLRVRCDEHVLYPNPSQTAGYVPCDLEGGVPVRAVDDGHTALDGDPLVRMDLRAGTITVQDRGHGVEPFRATVRIDRR